MYSHFDGEIISCAIFDRKMTTFSIHVKSCKNYIQDDHRGANVCFYLGVYVRCVSHPSWPGRCVRQVCTEYLGVCMSPPSSTVPRAGVEPLCAWNIRIPTIRVPAATPIMETEYRVSEWNRFEPLSDRSEINIKSNKQLIIIKNYISQLDSRRRRRPWRVVWVEWRRWVLL